MKKYNIVLVFVLVFSLMFIQNNSIVNADQDRERQENMLISGNNIDEVEDELDTEESGDLEEDDDEDVDDDFMKRAEERRIQFADNVQELVRSSERIGNGIGEEVRVMAQDQERDYEDAEDIIKNVSKRGGFARFFIGPNYSEIKKVEDYAQKYTDRLEKLGETVSEITAQDVISAIDAQIKEMEQVKADLEVEIEAQKGGFSLFGWLNRLLSI